MSSTQKIYDFIKASETPATISQILAGTELKAGTVSGLLVYLISKNKIVREKIPCTRYKREVWGYKAKEEE